MKRIISFYVLALVLWGFVFCASSAVALQNGSPVWKVSTNDNTLFLAGSVHILRATDFPLPKEFDYAFAQSAALVLETDVEQMANEDIAQYLMSQMLLPEEQTLGSVLDTDTYELLAAECSKYNFSIDNVARFKPSMVITMITVLQMQQSGFVEEGVDAYYIQKAKTENKPVMFLESINSQIDALITMGDGYENDYVRYSLNDMANTDAELTTLTSEWRTGGLSSSEAALEEMQTAWPAIYKALLLDRNAAWMPQIETFLASGQVYFVIVGFLHLPGPDGLLRQLEDLGYAVEQLR